MQFVTYLKSINLELKTVLELGCGTGLISAFCANKGALVTASDINDEALRELAVQSRNNHWNIISVYSDLFENLHFHFDYILINPPIKTEQTQSRLEFGNFAGIDFDYFQRLFSQLRARDLEKTEVLMFLPEETELFSINRKASEHYLKLKTVKVIRKGLGSGTVYRVVLDS